MPPPKHPCLKHPLPKSDAGWKPRTPGVVILTIWIYLLDSFPGSGDCSLCTKLPQSPASFCDHCGYHLLCYLGPLDGQIWAANWWVPVSRQKASRQALVLAEMVNISFSPTAVEACWLSPTPFQKCVLKFHPHLWDVDARNNLEQSAIMPPFGKQEMQGEIRDQMEAIQVYQQAPWFDGKCPKTNCLSSCLY